MLESLIAAFYLQGGVAYMVPSPTPSCVARPICYYLTDINRVYNPYGNLEVGLEFGGDDDNMPFTYTFALRHESSIPAADYGQNTVEFRIKYHPFR
jgi:hypothetical protein